MKYIDDIGYKFEQVIFVLLGICCAVKLVEYLVRFIKFLGE